jgi:hypothetical protein
MNEPSAVQHQQLLLPFPGASASEKRLSDEPSVTEFLNLVINIEESWPPDSHGAYNSVVSHYVQFFDSATGMEHTYLAAFLLLLKRDEEPTHDRVMAIFSSLLDAIRAMDTITGWLPEIGAYLCEAMDKHLHP